MKQTTSKRMERRIVVPMVFTAVIAASGPAQAEVVDIPVNKTALVTTANAALSGIRVKVHNLGRRSGSSWLDQGSYVLLPTGQRRPFSVPEQSFRFPKTNRHLKHYVSDFSSSSMKVFADGAHLLFVVEFESQGEEIKGKCVRRGGVGKNRRWVECSLGMERDVHLNNARAEIKVAPVAYDGAVAYRVVGVKFRTDVDISNRLCKAAKGICGRIENWLNTKITQSIEKAMRDAFNDGKMKQRFADAVRGAAGRFSPPIDPRWRVTKVRSSGRRFLVTVQRPDQVNGKSVRTLSLNKGSSPASVNCPAQVEMSATIDTKYAIKGTGYLVHENGKKGRRFDWRTNKPGKVTSKLVRSFKGKAGKTFNRLRSKLVVRWKGIDGKMHQKSSNFVRYRVACRSPTPGLGTAGR